MHRQVSRLIFAVFVLVLLTSVRGPIHAEVKSQPPAGRTPETPDDAPAELSAWEDRRARSPGARVFAGAYVSVQVNVDGSGQNIVGDAGNEPSIAVNPTNPNNMVIGWRQFDNVGSNFRQAGWGYTQDGGQTWTFPGTLTPGVFRSDPVLGTDSSGNFYYQGVRSTFDVDVFRSADGGQSWGPPVPSFGGDKNWMAIDNSGGIGDGHVYGVWQRFSGCCGQRTFTRSIDGAASFEPPVVVALRPIFGTMAVGPAGEVYVSGVEGTFFQNFDQFVMAKSTNAQNAAVTPTFTGSRVDMGGSMVFGGVPNPIGLLGQANVAVDDSPTGASRGNVYLLASVNPPGVDPADVHLIRSTDGGATWSAPIRVNNDAPSFNSYQWFGAHSVSPLGRIDVIWNDTRHSQQANVSELFYAYSYDEGDTWYGNIPVSPPFDSFLGFPNQDKLGDYYTIVSDETGADVAYAATFNQEQDVYYLRVFPDCNGNGISDVVDILNGILNGTSPDLNGNWIPDECETIHPLITANGSAGPLVIGQAEPLELSVRLHVGPSYVGLNADWWILGDTPFGSYYYDNSGTWLPGLEPTYQGPLFPLGPTLVLGSPLPVGSYTFYFGIDSMDGVLGTPLFFDDVEVEVVP